MAISYLQVEGLTKSFGDLVLFENLSFGISEGDRVGLIAKNGSGKTTLLSILAGDEGYDVGSVIYRNDLRIEYLSQDPQFPEGVTVADVCDQASPELERILTKLKITDMHQPVSQMSGGQRKRLALAHVLIDQPQMLILDEPTNHLDLEMVEWLEDYLNHTRMTILMVTHDRYFLDNVCNKIFEMADRTLYPYKGNYAYYLEKRDERIAVQNANIDRANNLLRKELDWMRRQPQARGHKSRTRIEAFYELEERAKRRREQIEVRLSTRSSYIGSKIFEAKNVCKSFESHTPGEPDKVILKDYNYTFARYEKMGIVGSNGTGKTTFIKMLLGQIPPTSGRFVIGETVRFGYFSQEGMPIDNEMKVIDVVRRVAETIDLGGGQRMTAMQFLNHFLFPPKRQQDYVYKLSGGEKRRLQLCLVLMQNPNFLILDEPTNDLDIATLQILEEYLADFRGCVIVVSHDRYFMDKVVDHLLVFKGRGEVDDFPGNYTQYRDYCALKEKEEQAAAREAEAKRERNTASNTATTSNNRKPVHEGSDRRRRLTFAERKEYEQLEKDVGALETEKTDIEARLCSGTLSVDDITALSRRLSALNDELDDKSMRWLELSEFA